MRPVDESIVVITALHFAFTRAYDVVMVFPRDSRLAIRPVYWSRNEGTAIMPSLAIETDFVVLGANRDIVALVEVKNLKELSADTAAAIRQNLVANSDPGLRSPFFMLVSQDVGYLWDQRSEPQRVNAVPTTEFSMEPVVRRYLPSFVHGPRLRGSQLALAVNQWLSDLAADATDQVEAPELALSESGFLDMIRGGRVIAEFEN
jgi:hypothetical protein